MVSVKNGIEIKKQNKTKHTQGYCMNPKENTTTPSMLLWFKTWKPAAELLKCKCNFNVRKMYFKHYLYILPCAIIKFLL